MGFLINWALRGWVFNQIGSLANVKRHAFAVGEELYAGEGGRIHGYGQGCCLFSLSAGKKRVSSCSWHVRRLPAQHSAVDSYCRSSV